MKSSKEQQGEIRKPSSAINARNRGKQQNVKDQKYLRENQRQGIYHAKMGSIKDQNCMDLIETEDIKKRWQEYTEKLNKKDLHNPDNHDGVITHLEPDIWNAKSSGPQEASL